MELIAPRNEHNPHRFLFQQTEPGTFWQSQGKPS